MKVIDLLNKIANGEEVPKKIAIQNEVLIYNKDEILYLQDYYYIADEEDATWKIWAYDLNDEVEILEEEKKIPEKLDYKYKNMYGNISQHKQSEIDIINTLNSVIDYLKSKGE